MTQDKALQIFEASFYLDRAVVNRALAVLSGNGDATSTVGAMLRDMERMALELRRLHIETERLKNVEIVSLEAEVIAHVDEIERLRAALDMVAEERDAWKERALGLPQEPCRHADHPSAAEDGYA